MANRHTLINFRHIRIDLQIADTYFVPMNDYYNPRRLRRLNRIFDSAPSYFLTFCTDGQKPVLDQDEIMKRAKDFIAESFERYGIWVDCFMLMPDHVHLIITISAHSDVTVGEWVKAFKAMVARHEFRWQTGYFDHVLRSDESRSEKWAYIRANPVRAGLVNEPEQWPYAEWFNPLNGSKL